MNRALPMVLSVFLTPALLEARSLPPSAFPELPSGIVTELTQRGCRVPQLHWRKRNNVIQGAFTRQGQMDWAVVCKTRAQTTLLVFPQGADQHPMAVERVQNGLYVDMSITGISWQAMVDRLKQTQLKPAPVPPLDHDGISYWLGPRNPDSRNFGDNAAEGGLLYFDGSKWTRLWTMIAN
jgi:hypothetical protein